LDGTAKIQEDPTVFKTVFGSVTKVTGFANTTRGAGDETVRAQNFFVGGLRTGQFTTNGAGTLTVLGDSAIDGPSDAMVNKKLNPWRYNSSSPTNNPGTYDLWIDYLFGGQTNRICNWSDRPLVVH
jgi:hypothetical protein